MSNETVSQLQRRYNKSELAQEVFKLRGQVKREEAKDPKIKDAEDRADQEALDAVTALPPEEMASRMTSLGVSVNNTLQQVTSEIIQGRNTLTNLERACEAKKGELENLFGQEVLARSIGNLLADLDATKKEAETKKSELAEDQARAEAAAERQKAEWEANFQKSCNQTQTDWSYEFAKEQRNQRDAFAQQLQTERRNHDDQERERKREWEIREENVQKREQEVSVKEAEAATLEEEIKARAEKEKKGAIDAISRNHKHEMQMVQKDADTAAQIAQSTIKTQEEQMLKQQAEIEALKSRLTEVQEKNTELAKSALESASGRFALDSVMQHGGNDGKSARGKA